MNTDPIADMLTRIRNAVRNRKEDVIIEPKSNLKLEILKILKREGYIQDYQVISEERGGKIKVVLKYDETGEPVIEDLQRVSKPSRRVYVSSDKIPWVKNGMGIAIISTSQGLMTDREARRKKVGGELMLYVW